MMMMMTRRYRTTFRTNDNTVKSRVLFDHTNGRNTVDSGPLSQRSAGHTQYAQWRHTVKLKLTLTLTLTLTDTGDAVLALMLGYRSLYITWQ